MFGECARELQYVAIKVLSQTTSASNCERNYSTFSYIHTKTRNRLKYKNLQKFVFTFCNMKLKMRHEMRRSQESIDESFNPINLDYIFQEEDPLSPWLEESESPLLDGANSDWLPRVDSDDEDVQISSGQSDDDSDSNGGTNKSDGSPDNNSGDEATIQGDQSDEEQEYADQDVPLSALYGARVGRSVGGSSSSKGQSKSKGKRIQQRDVADDSSSSMVQSFNSFSMNEELSEGGYHFHSNPPPYYPYSSYYPQYPSLPDYQLPYQYPTDLHLPQQQSGESNYPQNSGSQNYQELYQYPTGLYMPQQQQTDESSSGFVDYVFGSRPGGDNEDEGSSYDPPRHSTMW